MNRLVHVQLYTLVERAVEAGVACGYRRAFKHSDEVDAQSLVESIVQGVMLELSEVIDYEGQTWRTPPESPEGFGEEAWTDAPFRLSRHE